MAKKELHKSIKKLLNFSPTTPSEEINDYCNSKLKKICKPCWELKYCPYGPLVEGFPLPPPERESAINHNKYLKRIMKAGKFDDGKAIDKSRKKLFHQMISKFKAGEYPEHVPTIIRDMACRVFGHLCPVYFVAETATETKEQRKSSRHIPREVMLKVVRRDSQTCQKCQELVPDNEVEFDHIIPFSKGGTSTVDNLRLVHRKCNRKKSSKVDHLLHESPIEHNITLLAHVKKKKK